MYCCRQITTNVATWCRCIMSQFCSLRVQILFICVLSSSLHQAEVGVSLAAAVLIWDSFKLTSCQQNSFPCKCIIENPVFLLLLASNCSGLLASAQISLLHSPCRQFIRCVLPFQTSRNVSLWWSLLLKTPLIKSASPRTISFLIDLELTDSHLITEAIILIGSVHTQGQGVGYRDCTPENWNLGGLLRTLLHRARFIPLGIVSGCFCVKTAEWNSCDRLWWHSKPCWYIIEKFADLCYSWADISIFMIYCTYLEWQISD